MNPNKLSDLAYGIPVKNWLVLGPFVIQTSEHFEREYLYERHRILDIDYLAEDGGEAHITPEIGKVHRNIGLGPKTIAWKSYPYSDLFGMHIAGDLIYETVQRNCVIYAATYIESDRDTLALFDAYHSGMKLWMNGELVCNEPYGMTKGMRTSMPSKILSLKSGNNILLIKFRPGYICDGIDFCVRNVTISPLICQSHIPVAFGRIRALNRFTGTLEIPRQLFELAVVNTSRVGIKATVSAESNILQAHDSTDIFCEPGKVTIVRLALPSSPEIAGQTIDTAFRLKAYGKELTANYQYTALPPPQHDGRELVLTSFHFDTTYHEEQRVYAMGAFDIMRAYCQMHRIDPLFRSTISEIDYLKPYFDMFPEDRETILEIFREGRSSPDVMYNQPNEQNCSGEALVRNFLYGQLFHGGVLGGKCYCYGPGDVFGHPNQLSQIARKSGCIGIYWDKHIFNFPPFFQHVALDGSSLPHKRGEARWEDVQRMGLSIIPGNIDQTPPTNWHHSLVPKVEQATYKDLMTIINNEISEKGAHLPVTSRDMSLYHAATSLSRVDLKIANRLGENVLLLAERFATLANYYGAEYPEKALDKAWRQILCGQHHDSITGTHNEISFVDLMNSYREVLELGVDVLERSLTYLGQSIKNNKPGYPLIVFNPLAWNRTDVVHATIELDRENTFAILDHRGKQVSFEILDKKIKNDRYFFHIQFLGEDLPSLGYRTYRIVPQKKALPVRKINNTTTIENEFYTIEVDPNRGGGIISIYDKLNKREYINASTQHVGNELAILQEVPDREETQHEFYTTGLAMFSNSQKAVVETEVGPISQTIRSRYQMGEICDVIQEITVYKGIKRIDFTTVLVDYQGEDNLFCITFPTTLKGAMPIFDERFGVVTRNDSKNYLDFRTHRQIMFSDCAVYAANKWMEYGVNAIVQVGNNKYPLGMVALVTHDEANDIKIAEELQRVLIKKGVTCTPWFDEGGPTWGSYLPHMDEDLLYTRFRISLSSGNRNTYSQKLLSKLSLSSRRKFQKRLKENGYAFLLVRDADLKDDSWPPLPVLIVEAKDHHFLQIAIKELTRDYNTKAIIKLPAECLADSQKSTVENFGIAIINEGTYANSIEKGGVICMMLTHTCRWYGGTNNFPEGYLIPENKNHVFRYALYPHRDDWRKAQTQHRAYEFNFPLIARMIQPTNDAFLPLEHSFLQIEPSNVILEAMKPYGNPIAGFKRHAICDASKGIMLRLYDTNGENTKVTINTSLGITTAWKANLIEEKEEDLHVSWNGIAFDLPAFSIETIGFVPSTPDKQAKPTKLGVEKEPVQPVWVRSWEHDAESMPMGYEAVVCSISREVKEEDDGKLLYLKVNAVNDYVDATISGTAELIIPKGWTASPKIIPFTLEPLGHQITNVELHRPNNQASGQIKLRFEFDGQTFQDVLEIGQPFALNISATNCGDHIIVSVENPSQEIVEAEVALVSPIETWPSALVQKYSLIEITPRTIGLSIKPNSKEEVKFQVLKTSHEKWNIPVSYWAVAKLMSNGRIMLKRCDWKPPRRKLSDAKWLHLYKERVKLLYGTK